jgi:hypothetical protein
MAEVTGVVEAVSTKFDKYSIMVNDKWYGTKMEWAKIKPNKGEVVTFDDGGKNYLKNVKVTGVSDSVPSSGGKKTWSNLGVELGHASNIARDICLAKHGKMAGSDEFYKDFIEHTEKVFAVMKELRKSHEAPSTVPEVKAEVKSESSDEDDLY